MPSLQIHWFSGTGNARKAAQWIAEEVTSQGGDALLINIADDSKMPHSAADPDVVLGFCYPTHGFNAPPLVLKYVWNFPRGRNVVFLLNTRAGLKLSKLHVPGIGGLALWLPFLMLWLKGYRVRGFRPLDMPSNWISLHPGVRPKVAASIHRHCRDTIRRFSARMLGGKRVLNGLLWLPIDLAVSPIAVLYYLIGRFMLAKTFFASYRCNDCGKCIRECPVQAIVRRDGRPYWKFRCESCMHCMNHCPERAIETAHAYVFLMWWGGGALAGILLLEFLPSIDISVSGSSDLAGYAGTVLRIGIRLMVVYLAYHLMHFLLRYRWFNYLITYTSLTKFGFWRRYKADGVKSEF